MNLVTLFGRIRGTLGMIHNAGMLPVIVESEDGAATFTVLSVRVDSKAGVFISIKGKGKEAENGGEYKTVQTAG